MTGAADVADRALSQVEALTAKIGELAPGVWTALVEYHRVAAITHLALMGFLIVASIAGCIVLWRASRVSVDARGWSNGLSEGQKIFAIVGFMVCVSTALIASLRVPRDLVDAAYPERAAVRDVLK